MSEPSSPTYCIKANYCPPTPEKRSTPRKMSSNWPKTPTFGKSSTPRRIINSKFYDSDSVGPSTPGSSSSCEEGVGRSPFSEKSINSYSPAMNCRNYDCMSNYEIIETIGHGNTSTVSKAKSIVDGKYYAIKTKKLQSNSVDHKENQLQEVYALIEVGSENRNVVSYKSHWFDEENLHIVTEYCEGGSVANESWAPCNDSKYGYGSKISKKNWSEEELMDLTQQVASGLSFLHSRNIAHMDVKMDNIFITYDSQNNRIYKIGDLGLVRAINNKSLNRYRGLNNEEGDARYVDRYLLNRVDKVCEADVYSLAASILELGYGFPAKTKGKEWNELIIDTELTSTLSQPFLELLSSMVNEDPSLRPTCEKIAHIVSDMLSDSTILRGVVLSPSTPLKCGMDGNKDQEALSFSVVFH